MNNKLYNMDNTAKSMSRTGIRYFSNLTAKQKDKSIFKLRVFKAGLEQLPEGLAEGILRQSDYWRPDLNGCKMFYIQSLNCWMPLNIKEIINN